MFTGVGVLCLVILNIPADSLSISFGMGLSITHNAGRGVLRWLRGHDLQGALGSIPVATLFFSPSAGLY